MSKAQHISIEPVEQRVVVRFAGEVVADSRRAVQLKEGSIPPRLYIPRDDVRMEHLRPTDHTTHCPYKGDASYFTLAVGDRSEPNAGWSYEKPIDEVAKIAGLVSFYPAKVEIETT